MACSVVGDEGASGLLEFFLYCSTNTAIPLGPSTSYGCRSSALLIKSGRVVQ